MAEVKMSNKIFTDKELEILSRNQYVKAVSMSSITYNDEFKSIFIAANEQGKFPREIFEDHGFDIKRVRRGDGGDVCMKFCLHEKD